MRYWLVEVEESDVGHASCNLAEGVTRADFVHVLDERALVYFVREFVGEPSGGAFSLNKPKAKLLSGLEKHRLVHDAVNPNKRVCLRRFQQLYAWCCAMDPVRAAKLGCGSKAMNIASPASVGALPKGAACCANTDYRCYFFQWLQLRHLWFLQGLFNVEGRLRSRARAISSGFPSADHGWAGVCLPRSRSELDAAD